MIADDLEPLTPLNLKTAHGEKVQDHHRFLFYYNGAWLNTLGRPMIALDDLDTDYYIFDAKNPLTPEIIRDFIDRCQEIDEIITERMQTDPDYYNPVQDGPY